MKNVEFDIYEVGTIIPAHEPTKGRNILERK
jgi:hypothetical protein